jgi:hypothetical protein
MASTAVATAADSPQHPITEPSPDRNDSSNSSPNFFADAEFQVLLYSFLSCIIL